MLKHAALEYRHARVRSGGVPLRLVFFALAGLFSFGCSSQPEPPSDPTAPRDAHARSPAVASSADPGGDAYATCENGWLRVSADGIRVQLEDGATSLELSVGALHAWREGEAGDFGDDAHRALLPIDGSEMATVTSPEGVKRLALRDLQLTWPDRHDPFMTVTVGDADAPLSVQARACRYADEQLPTLESHIR